MRLAETRFLVVTSSSSQVRDFDWLRRHIPSEARAVATDVTSAYAVLGVMGPRSRPLLQSLTRDDLSHVAFPFGAAREISRDSRHLTVYVENAGDFVVPVSAVVSVQSEKVAFDCKKLDAKLRAAIASEMSLTPSPL